MPETTKVPILLPTDGTQSAEVKEYTMIPRQTDAGLGVVKDPTAGAWVALTAFPNLNKLGYVTARTRLGTRATKVRFVITDHPDGPA
jgi:hypothetical protein